MQSWQTRKTWLTDGRQRGQNESYSTGNFMCLVAELGLAGGGELLWHLPHDCSPFARE
jgi:hypothetical protein